MRNDPAMTMDQIAKALQVSRSALYRQLGSTLQQEQPDAGRIAEEYGCVGSLVGVGSLSLFSTAVPKAVEAAARSRGRVGFCWPPNRPLPIEDGGGDERIGWVSRWSCWSRLSGLVVSARGALAYGRADRLLWRRPFRPRVPPSLPVRCRRRRLHVRCRRRRPLAARRPRFSPPTLSMVRAM